MRTVAVAGLSLVLITGALIAGAMAQEPPIWFGKGTIPDDLAKNVLAGVTANITSAVDERGRPLAPLTAEQAATPLLDLALVKEVLDVGAASGLGVACKLDWQERNYLKLMARERARGDRSTHQIAAISMVHGFMMGQFDPRLACSPDRKEEVESFYRRKWAEKPVSPPKT
jgi:hypothetical protein